jgi:hypothetical protein
MQKRFLEIVPSEPGKLWAGIVQVMNTNENPTPKRAADSRFEWAGLVALGLLVCFAAISEQSYWIDELCTVWKAVQPTVADWWQAMRAEGDSMLQIPLYEIFAWAWEKLAGPGEFAMRAGNMLWFLPGLMALAAALKETPLRRWCASLALLSSPFAWYYLNEARPYAMQIGASCMVLAALYQLGPGKNESSRLERCWVIIFCLGSLVLAASGMLAMLWLGAYWGGAILSTSIKHLQKLAKAYWACWTMTLALLFALGLYYLWTLSIGARATNAGTTDVKNVLFIFYELLGFTGQGPGRLEIRYGGFATFRQWLPWLAVYGVMSLLVLVRGCRQLTMTISRRTWISWLLVFALVMGFILAVGVTVRFRVLGRHCAPLLPLVLFLQGIGLASWLKEEKWPWRYVVVLFLGMSLVSDASVRFSVRHAKDDYRDAAVLGREALARGESVWWSAEIQGAWVYHLPVAKQPTTTNAAVFLVNPGMMFLQTLPKPDCVLLSKPDLYDGQGAIQYYLAQNNYRVVQRLPAFTVWRKK